MEEIETKIFLKRKEFLMSFDNLDKRQIQAILKQLKWSCFSWGTK